MMIKHVYVVMLLFVAMKLTHSEQHDPQVNEEEPEAEGVPIESTTNTTEEPLIAHGCPTIPKY
ncbi:hypothetical protein MTO96_041049, partial [Rhipicephalus appendiculatus]